MSNAIQLPLDLPSREGWGGARPGAGRKPGAKTPVPHRGRGPVSRHTPCHITLRVRRGMPSLREARLVRELERSFGATRERDGFRVVHYSIQRDHVHLLVEADGAAPLARGMIALGARLARAVNRVFRRRGAVLQERFHHRLLRTPREVRNALAYVLCNFRKHAAAASASRRGFGAAIDPASSGRWFSGWTRPPSPPEQHPPVAEPRSWLLRVGWWRHGRIDPAEVPGQRG